MPPTESASAAELAALPKMLQTTWCALTARLGLWSGESVLTRGASPAIGLCALQLARKLGVTRTAGATRQPSRIQIGDIGRLKPAGTFSSTRV